jgi:hypothetical protein
MFGTGRQPPALRSHVWLADPENSDTVALRRNRFFNFASMSGTESKPPRARPKAHRSSPYPPSRTPLQALQRSLVGQLETGAIRQSSEQFKRVTRTHELQRDNH